MQPVGLCSVGLEKLKIALLAFAYEDFWQPQILVADYAGTGLPERTFR